MSSCKSRSDNCCNGGGKGGSSKEATQDVPRCCNILDSGHTVCEGANVDCQEDGSLKSCCQKTDEGTVTYLADASAAPCSAPKASSVNLYRRWIRWAWAIEIASGLHCAAEGAVSIFFATRDGQISLLLFGLDSVIEQSLPAQFILFSEPNQKQRSQASSSAASASSI
ncbi:g480 [Coccomyxa elongata]